MSRYATIAKALHARIQHGDYRFQEFPTVSRLAMELGVNPRTVAKAMDELHRVGLLERSESGRFAVREVSNTEKDVHIALLLHPHPSAQADSVYRLVQRCTKARNWKLRLISYVHWRDPAIAGALRGFDASLFVPTSGAGGMKVLPDHLVNEIKTCGRPVLVLFADTSAEQIPCLHFVSPGEVAMLLDSLLPSGHRKIACLNTQPYGGVTNERLNAWSQWTKLNGIEGQTIDRPGESAMLYAHKVFRETLRSGSFDATALFCTTGATAIGAMRALTDFGIEPGRDVAVCATDSEAGMAPMLRPSLTCMRTPAMDRYLDLCLDWFVSGQPWQGPYNVHPPQMQIFVGESTSNYRPK